MLIASVTGAVEAVSEFVCSVMYNQNRMNKIVVITTRRFCNMILYLYPDCVSHVRVLGIFVCRKRVGS